MQQLIQTHHDQVMNGALFSRHRAFHQLFDHPFELRKGAQYAKAELLQQRFIFIANFLLHRGQDVT